MEQNNFNTQALVRLIRTCRILRDLGQPILYHNLRYPHAGRLMHTLLARPDLVSSVRCMTLDYYWEKIGESDLPTANEAARKLGIALPEQWRIEALEYVMTWEVRPVALLDGSSINFPALRHLHLGYYDTEGGFDLGLARELFQAAPNLESLEIEMCLLVPPGLSLSKVKRLRFARSFLEGRHIENIFLACPQLEQFAYDTGGAALSQYAESREFTMKTLKQVLMTRKNTLRHLDLFVDKESSYDPLEDGNDEDSSRLGSFEDFPVLETLVAQPEYLHKKPDWDRIFRNTEGLVSLLPRSLKSLTLVPGHGRLYDGPETLVQAIGKGEFPNLKTVVLLPKSETKYLKEYAAVGVECVDYDRLQPGLPYPGWPGY
ncbi:hypothetical protein GQ53DRAFT_878054 [Thozetella sp. PMI_491]|nr:hypothetical protein GQ53DRAFT_878054 [Thozetella sp. PMI_491]